jgi:hypothetical protein
MKSRNSAGWPAICFGGGAGEGAASCGGVLFSRLCLGGRGEPGAARPGGKRKGGQSFRRRREGAAGGSEALRAGMRLLPRAGPRRQERRAAAEPAGDLSGSAGGFILGAAQRIPAPRDAFVRAPARAAAMANHHILAGRGSGPRRTGGRAAAGIEMNAPRREAHAAAAHSSSGGPAAAARSCGFTFSTLKRAARSRMVRRTSSSGGGSPLIHRRGLMRATTKARR